VFDSVKSFGQALEVCFQLARSRTSNGAGDGVVDGVDIVYAIGVFYIRFNKRKQIKSDLLN
jgi:hypothetical protein